MAKFDPAKSNMLEKIRAIDHRLDYIRLPEDKVTVEGKPLKQWIKDVGGKEALDYFLLVNLGDE